MISSVAVIGLGNVASRHRKNLKLRFSGVTVLAMSSSGRKVDESIDNADYVVNSIQDIIDAKPAFVIVASPSTYHAKHALRLLEKKIPVLIEKPVTASLSDSYKLIAASQLSQTPIAVGYCLRYLPSSCEMKRVLAEGLIGNVYNAFVHVGQFLPDWRDNKEFRSSVSAKVSLGGGALLELSHELDYIQWLLGDMNFEYAHLRTSHELDLEVEEIADLVLTSIEGVVCNVHLDFLQKKPHRMCVLIGSRGRLEWDLIGNTIVMHNAEGRFTIYSKPDWDKNEMYLDMVDDFVDMINSKPSDCIDIDQATKTVALIEEIKANAIWGVKQ